MNESLPARIASNVGGFFLLSSILGMFVVHPAMALFAAGGALTHFLVSLFVSNNRVTKRRNLGQAWTTFGLIGVLGLGMVSIVSGLLFLIFHSWVSLPFLAIVILACWMPLILRWNKERM